MGNLYNSHVANANAKSNKTSHNDKLAARIKRRIAAGGKTAMLEKALIARIKREKIEAERKKKVITADNQMALIAARKKKEKIEAERKKKIITAERALIAARKKRERKKKITADNQRALVDALTALAARKKRERKKKITADNQMALVAARKKREKIEAERKKKIITPDTRNKYNPDNWYDEYDENDNYDDNNNYENSNNIDDIDDEYNRTDITKLSSLKKKKIKQPPKNESQARDQIEQAIQQNIVGCLRDKCIRHFDDSKIQYISPQELIRYLPESLNIVRRKHVKKHHSGQWEIHNKNIHCYLGFRVVSNDYQLKQLLKDLQRKRSQQYRRRQQNIKNSIDEQKEVELGDCKICGRSKMNTIAAFGRHICRVSGYFQCQYFKCNGHSFKVGICLLDPETETPPTRYKCSYCNYVAKFIRYDLKQSQINDESRSSNKKHRSDLCEACDIWGDCQQPFVQPSNIAAALWDFFEVPSKWRMNENGDGVYCSFSMAAPQGQTDYQFETKPYVNCVRVNLRAYADKRYADMSNSSSDGAYGMVEEAKKDNFTRSQKYENPPARNITVCYNCGEEGHFARECPNELDVECFQCGEIGHYARDCQMMQQDCPTPNEEEWYDEAMCFHCGENGHFDEDCPNEECRCYNCGENGHFDGDCPNEEWARDCDQPVNDAYEYYE